MSAVKVRAAGVVPVRRTAAGWRVLGLRCYRNWDFPKGVVEPGESLRETALREAREEAALDDLAFRWGEATVDTPVYSRGKVATYFLAETAREAIELPVNPELGHPEHHEGRWLGFAEARELFPARLQGVLSWVQERLEGIESR